MPVGSVIGSASGFVPVALIWMIAVSACAHVNVIDFERLSLHRPKAVFDLPAGGKRLVQQVDGYKHIIKSGVPILADGAHTGALPGKLVRG